MKIIFYIACCMAIITTATNAVASNATTSLVEMEKVRDRVSIRIDELPEPVKNALNSVTAEGWEVDEAFLVTKDDQSKFYEIKIKKDEQRNVLQLDREGQPIH